MVETEIISFIKKKYYSIKLFIHLKFYFFIILKIRYLKYFFKNYINFYKNIILFNKLYFINGYINNVYIKNVSIIKIEKIFESYLKTLIYK